MPDLRLLGPNELQQLIDRAPVVDDVAGTGLDDGLRGRKGHVVVDEFAFPGGHDDRTDAADLVTIADKLAEAGFDTLDDLIAKYRLTALQLTQSSETIDRLNADMQALRTENSQLHDDLRKADQRKVDQGEAHEGESGEATPTAAAVLSAKAQPKAKAKPAAKPGSTPPAS